LRQEVGAIGFPFVLKVAMRVPKPGGKLGNVSLAKVPEEETDSIMEQSHMWYHRHFPQIADCMPIDSVQVLQDAGISVAVDKKIM